MSQADVSLIILSNVDRTLIFPTAVICAPVQVTGEVYLFLVIVEECDLCLHQEEPSNIIMA